MFEEVQRDINRELKSLTIDEPDPLARLEAFVLGILRRAHDTGQRHAVGQLLIQQFSGSKQAIQRSCGSLTPDCSTICRSLSPKRQKRARSNRPITGGRPP